MLPGSIRPAEVRSRSARPILATCRTRWPSTRRAPDDRRSATSRRSTVSGRSPSPPSSCSTEGSRCGAATSGSTCSSCCRASSSPRSCSWSSSATVAWPSAGSTSDAHDGCYRGSSCSWRSSAPTRCSRSPHGSLPSLPGQIVGTMAYVGNWTLIASHATYFTQGLPPSPLQHTWSLAIEEQFYLVWPVLLFGLRRLTRRRDVLAVLCVLGSLGCAVFSAVRFAQGTSVNELYFATQTHATTMLLGAAGACVLLRRAPRSDEPAFRLAPATLRRAGNVVGVVAWALVIAGLLTISGTGAALYRGGYVVVGAVVAVAIAATVLGAGRLVGEGALAATRHLRRADLLRDLPVPLPPVLVAGPRPHRPRRRAAALSSGSRPRWPSPRRRTRGSSARCGSAACSRGSRGSPARSRGSSPSPWSPRRSPPRPRRRSRSPTTSPSGASSTPSPRAPRRPSCSSATRWPRRSATASTTRSPTRRTSTSR